MCASDVGKNFLTGKRHCPQPTFLLTADYAGHPARTLSERSSRYKEMREIHACTREHTLWSVAETMNMRVNVKLEFELVYYVRSTAYLGELSLTERFPQSSRHPLCLCLQTCDYDGSSLALN